MKTVKSVMKTRQPALIFKTS